MYDIWVVYVCITNKQFTYVNLKLVLCRIKSTWKSLSPQIRLGQLKEAQICLLLWRYMLEKCLKVLALWEILMHKLV